MSGPTRYRIALVALLLTALVAVGGCPPPAAPKEPVSPAVPPPPSKTKATSGPEESTGSGLSGLATAQFAPNVPDIKVGAYLALSGPQATFGQSTRKAIELAADEINAAGGIGSKQITLIVKDDRSRKEDAASCVRMLIDQDKVDAILGEVASSNSLAAAPLCQEAGVPMITPSSTNPRVTQVGDCIFRVCFIDDFQGEVMARFVRNTLQAQKAAILTDLANDYSVGLGKRFREVFTELGGQIVAGDTSYAEGDKDFSGPLTKIAAADPDVLFVPGYYTDVALVAKQAKTHGLRATICGGDGYDSPKLVELAGEAANGLYFSDHCWKGDPSPTVRNFYQAYQAKHGAEPDALAALGYDAMYVLAHAFARAGSTDKAAVRDALAGTREFAGVTGTFSIDAQRNAKKAAVVLTIKDGAQALAETIPAD